MPVAAAVTVYDPGITSALADVDATPELSVTTMIEVPPVGPSKAVGLVMTQVLKKYVHGLGDEKATVMPGNRVASSVPDRDRQRMWKTRSDHGLLGSRPRIHAHRRPQIRQ